MPFLPLHDQNPRIMIARPWVTWGLILINCLVFYIQFTAAPLDGDRIVLALGVIPATLNGEAQLGPDLYLVTPLFTLLTHMFLHGGFGHLAGNMLFLWVFGDNIEDAMGHRRFILFYLAGGIAAALAQVLANTHSQTPLIGASGAIAAVMGAYLMLHPRAKVLVPIFFIPLYLPAYLLLIFWIVFQVLMASSGVDTDGGGIAWWAHVGGFVAGAIMIIPLRMNSLPLFGADNLPNGIELNVFDKNRERRQTEDGGGSGPWRRPRDPRRD